eukprot:7998159-Lingulodinium_polyedra.AAC.1
MLRVQAECKDRLIKQELDRAAAPRGERSGARTPSVDSFGSEPAPMSDGPGREASPGDGSEADE